MFVFNVKEMNIVYSGLMNLFWIVGLFKLCLLNYPWNELHEEFFVKFSSNEFIYNFQIPIMF